MKPHEERVIEEQKELQTKIDKLTDFLELAPLPGLEHTQYVLLQIQLTAMLTYNNVLVHRIRLFE